MRKSWPKRMPLMDALVRLLNAMQTELVKRIRKVILSTFHHLFLLAVKKRRTLRDGPIVRTATASGACKQSMEFGV